MSTRMNAQQNPNERLLEHGRHGLADNELLALVIGRGSPDESAQGLAQRLIERFGGLAGVAAATPYQLRAVRGLGQVRSARIAACLELGLRMSTCSIALPRRVASPEDVWQLVGRQLAFEEREVFKVVLLGGRNDVLAVRTVARGTRDMCAVHARDLFREAVVEGACAIILVHNHPSGDPTPSEEDGLLTRRAAEGGQLIGIPVIDHVIVTATGYRSLREEGCLA